MILELLHSCDWDLLLDLNALLFIALSLVYAIKIYRKVRIRDFIWLIIATAYGTFLRSLHFLRNFDFPVPDSGTVSHMFALFYILLFLGIMAYYRPIKEMWDSTP
jgi:hypothetical protein